MCRFKTKYLEKDYTELYTNNIYTLYQKIP